MGATSQKIIPIPKFITILIFVLALVLGLFAPDVLYKFFQGSLVQLIDYITGKAKVSFEFMKKSWVWTVGGGIVLLFMASKLEKIKIAAYGIVTGLIVRLMLYHIEYPVPDFIGWLQGILPL